MADTYEYKVVELREGLIGGKLSGGKLEGVLNEHGTKGWQLKAITAAEVKGRIGPGGVEGLLVTFERPTSWRRAGSGAGALEREKALHAGPSRRSAPEGIRTPNLLIRSQMLYPLSYGRTRRRDGAVVILTEWSDGGPAGT